MSGSTASLRVGSKRCTNPRFDTSAIIRPKKKGKPSPAAALQASSSFSSSASSSPSASSLIKNVSAVSPYEKEGAGEVVREVFGSQHTHALQQHSVAHITLKPGAKAGQHFHPVCEESYYVLSGAATMELGAAGQASTASQDAAGNAIVSVQNIAQNDVVAIPAKTVHNICNPSKKEECVIVAICVPAWSPSCSVFLKDLSTTATSTADAKAAKASTKKKNKK